MFNSAEQDQINALLLAQQGENRITIRYVRDDEEEKITGHTTIYSIGDADVPDDNEAMIEALIRQPCVHITITIHANTRGVMIQTLLHELVIHVLPKLHNIAIMNERPREENNAIYALFNEIINADLQHQRPESWNAMMSLIETAKLAPGDPDENDAVVVAAMADIFTHEDAGLFKGWSKDQWHIIDERCERIEVTTGAREEERTRRAEDDDESATARISGEGVARAYEGDANAPDIMDTIREDKDIRQIKRPVDNNNNNNDETRGQGALGQAQAERRRQRSPDRELGVWKRGAGRGDHKKSKTTGSPKSPEGGT